MKMTPEQWNGLVALIRAIAVAAAEPGALTGMEYKRQAGACEANVRKMFVDDTDPVPAAPDLDRLLLVTGDVCRLLNEIGTAQHLTAREMRARANILLRELELARVNARQTEDEGKTEAQKDTGRANRAARMVIDDRSPADPAVMVTLEHAVASVLLVACADARKAAGMLNEALVPGIESRLAMYDNKKGR